MHGTVVGLTGARNRRTAVGPLAHESAVHREIGGQRRLHPERQTATLAGVWGTTVQFHAVRPALCALHHLQENQPPGVPPLALTGERTLPDIPEENYWFRRHLAVYEWIA